ncbi:MAG: cobalamin-dependent protein [Clostridiales Family XIII bacterium]|jgi:methanogenic corrinoid protein MtbC1|nr:cobalamin-dependent protein [Clostridiales Family XIII bacterium]
MSDTGRITELLGDLKEQDVYDAIDGIIASHPAQEDILDTIGACQKGMDVVGEKFEEGVYFFGELMYAAQIMDTAIGKLKPLVVDVGGDDDRGVIILGSVAGDIHDIGKNIFRSLAEASGFNVIDIGIDKQPEAFVQAVNEHRPGIVGLSGVLTLSIESMRMTIAALADAGLRDDVKVLIGGNAASEEACIHTGADYWTKNAAAGVKKCKEYSGE